MKMHDLSGYLLLLVLIAAVLAGCTAASGDEPIVVPSNPDRDTSEDSAGSGLATIAPVTEERPAPRAVATDEGVAVEEIEQAGDRGQDVEMGDESDRQDTNEPVTPAVVDLSKVTPEAFTESETLQEMPQPGLPNPSAAASNKAAVDLANALGLEAEDVQIISIEQVDWPDSSLGCPTAGESYSTIVTPGFRILLDVNGQRYEYHADMDGRTVRCG